MQKGIDHIGLTVVYFCHDGKENYLLAKRGVNTRDEQGTWDFGAGAVEFGHTVEETLKKEIKEEYCTDVMDYEFIGYRDVQREHNGKKTHWIALDFKVFIDPSKVANGEPHKLEQIGWFTMDNLPSPLISTASMFLQKYKGKL